jgi:methionyl-tRNA formyltransferase
MELKSPHIKTWAEMKGIPVLQPEKLTEEEFLTQLRTNVSDVYIVASYGKIIPDEILSLPKHGVLNVHPSLLPCYRGPSPIESTLLAGDITTGVTIMKLDKEMDHGPILVQSAFMLPQGATSGTLEVECGQLGGELLTQIMEPYLHGALIPKEQDHTKATYCKKITKDMGEITLGTPAREVQRKFRALTPWPGLFFFTDHGEHKLRVKVTDVDQNTQFSDTSTARDCITRVIPEGKKEMDWESFLRGYEKS